MTCSSCGAENRAGRKFCSSCGAPLTRACAACGAGNEPDDRFCGECGSRLDPEPRGPATVEAERRLVSVLFGDLVGFTPLSESRDPEEVRELLSRYFETARRVVDRYGGTIEKFIGDAVMAVWGAPVAREDDAERAVRAGLELVEVVAALGEEVGAEALAMRVGVVTGEAAVTVGAEGQGMVAGDLVNTASRVQAAAEAATVLVGERTRRASEAAVAYDDAGKHELKGKAEPVLLFEDLQWADPALLDFVDYLLDWSRAHPMFVVTLARPELGEKHPAWGGTKRDFTSLTLEPLRDEAMDELLAGLVPGLPAELRNRIRERAEGVPLYAVETVRMLLDRGLLRHDGDGYVAAEEVGSLEVPETLHALIAARLDDLDTAERRVIEDAAVLGKTFTLPGLGALTGMGEAELGPTLASLVRKDLLTVQSDPRSPERGNYGFLQALVQRIAHDTLSRKERKARHLAAARYLEESWGSDDAEIVEVTAPHSLDASHAD